MSSMKKSNKKIFNVLWSSRDFGGAEIYVETMRKTWGTETIALENLSIKEILSLTYNISFGSDNYIFHDIRAALLGFFSPNRKHITVVHGPGRSILITKVIIFLQAFIQKKVILVSSNIFQMQINLSFFFDLKMLARVFWSYFFVNYYYRFNINYKKI